MIMIRRSKIITPITIPAIAPPLKPPVEGTGVGMTDYRFIELTNY